MSFVGATRAVIRPILNDYAKDIHYPVAIIGVGNFTIPAILRQAGYTGEIISCDVSLYSSAMGAYLSGGSFEAHEKENCPEHLKGFLQTDTAENLVASILLLFDLREVWQCKNPYQERIVEQYKFYWPDLLERTKEKLAAYKKHIADIRYEAKDGFQLLKELAQGHTVITYPPTYKRGYERLERLYSAIIEWSPPEYEDMTDKTLDLYELIASFDDYVVILEKDLPEVYDIVGHPVSIAHSGRNTKIYIIRKEKAKQYLVHRDAESSPIGDIWPPERSITGEETLSFAFLNNKQSIRLNELFMSSSVDYTTQGSNVSMGYFLDGMIIGKSDFCRSMHRWALPDESEMLYLMSDLAVPSAQKKFAKLILLALLSKDVHEQLRLKYIENFGWVGTTAFSNKPVSMKYRGIFKLHTRKETGEGYSLNYYAPFAEYKLSDVVGLWLKKYGK